MNVTEAPPETVRDDGDTVIPLPVACAVIVPVPAKLSNLAVTLAELYLVTDRMAGVTDIEHGFGVGVGVGVGVGSGVNVELKYKPLTTALAPAFRVTLILT